MKKIFLFFIAVVAVVMTGCTSLEAKPDMSNMHIKVTHGDKVAKFRLYETQAAKELIAQLPLKIEVKDYSDNEKIFYPPKKLSTADTPLADAKAGTLAYYAPWGDVVMFYKDFGKASGLYELAEVIEGKEFIKKLSGNIEIIIDK